MKKKWLGIILGCVMVLSLGLGYAWNKQKALPVAIIRVEPGFVSQTVTEEGIVNLATQQIITSPISGKIKECAVKEGEKVQVGDVLFVVDTEALRKQKEQVAKNALSLEAQAQALSPVLEQALRQIEQSQTQLERITALTKAGAASSAEVEAATQEVANARTAYAEAEQNQIALRSLAEAARLQEKQLEDDLAQSQVRASANGYIQALNIQTGSYVTPQAEVGILAIGEELFLETLVQTGQVALLQVGDEVEIKAKQGEETIATKGIIKEILPYAVEKLSPLGLTERRVPIKISFDPSYLPLRPGYNADVIFTLVQAMDALAVPKTAVFAYEDGNALWKVNDGRAQLQIIEQGFKSAYDVVINSGLQPGDLVIVNGDQGALREGIKIKPIF